MRNRPVFTIAHTVRKILMAKPNNRFAVQRTVFLITKVLMKNDLPQRLVRFQARLAPRIAALPLFYALLRFACRKALTQLLLKFRKLNFDFAV